MRPRAKRPLRPARTWPRWSTSTPTECPVGSTGLQAAGPDSLVHLHGGGFVFHDVEVHDATARRVANRCGIAVLSVDYRRPPEHRFPAAPDDVDAVLAGRSQKVESLLLVVKKRPLSF